MAYHGYINKIQEHCKFFEAPSVMEVGVSTGLTAIPLIHLLDKSHKQFGYMGIDIDIRDGVKRMVDHMNLKKEIQVELLEGESLKVLPDLVKRDFKFEVILVDGDHDYDVIRQELAYIPHLMHVDTMLIIDDYDTTDSTWKVGETQPRNIRGQKYGVRFAVNKYLDAHPELITGKLFDGEPVVIFHKDSTLIPFRSDQVIRERSDRIYLVSGSHGNSPAANNKNY
jgi:predicted O-methyltransferase YrrM